MSKRTADSTRGGVGAPSGHAAHPRVVATTIAALLLAGALSGPNAAANPKTRHWDHRIECERTIVSNAAIGIGRDNCCHVAKRGSGSGGDAAGRPNSTQAKFTGDHFDGFGQAVCGRPTATLRLVGDIQPLVSGDTFGPLSGSANPTTLEESSTSSPLLF